MIDEKTEKIYNIIFSIFLGIIAVIIFNSLFTAPRVITIYSNKSEHFENTHHNGNDCFSSCVTTHMTE